MISKKEGNNGHLLPGRAVKGRAPDSCTGVTETNKKKHNKNSVNAIVNTATSLGGSRLLRMTVAAFTDTGARRSSISRAGAGPRRKRRARSSSFRKQGAIFKLFILSVSIRLIEKQSKKKMVCKSSYYSKERPSRPGPPLEEEWILL